MTQQKPSAGALRAAEALCERELLDAPIGTLCEPDRSEIAQIIDRETGVAELLEAAKDADHLLAPYDTDEDLIMCASPPKASAHRWLKQAIAKCETGR